MSFDLINEAVKKGAVLFPNVSGGKDGQAMTKVLLNNDFPIAGLVHADLGRTEWKESMGMCERLADECGVELHVIRRSDGRDMIDHWNDRLEKMKPTAYEACDVLTRREIILKVKPFWSSAKNRYCTSDMKRDPINKFYRNCGHNFIISCEGIRAQESTKRGKKIPLTIRPGVTSKYYEGMTVAEAIENFNPEYRLVLTWYPIFNFTIEDVWWTYGMTPASLEIYRSIYRESGEMLGGWPFHPAYVYGNNRVSCVFCIMGCEGDLKNGAKHRPELLDIMIEMEERGDATFKNDFSLKELK